MAQEIKPTRYIIHPQKFMVWLFIVAIILFFGGITSGYIVSKGIEVDKNIWLFFNLPNIFWYNSAVLLISSVTVQWAVWMAGKADFSRANLGLLLTFVLGVFFLIGQIVAWRQLATNHVVFGGAASYTSGNYLYVLTGTHWFHIIAGLVFLAVVWIKSMRGKYVQGQTMAFENAATFWHFLGLLWIYLFIFLLVNQS
ncbi:MAG: heme-copper oxidase subunit III [Bacteroidia bacterium]|nr:heme-copper oxidase subunit III [Bacteroidia bacterium]